MSGGFTRMGLLYSLRGWLEMDDERCEQVRHIIEADEDALSHYRESWCFQTRGGGGTKFAFFGSVVRESGLSSIRRQVERIATTVSSRDGDITDFVSGVFHVTSEDETREIVWICRDGRFSESVHEPGS